MQGFRYDAIMALEALVKDDKIKHVRTPEGSRYFDLPIGAPIIPGTTVHMGRPDSELHAHQANLAAQDAYVQMSPPTGTKDKSMAMKVQVNHEINGALWQLAHDHPEHDYSKRDIRTSREYHTQEDNFLMLFPGVYRRDHLNAPHKEWQELTDGIFRSQMAYEQNQDAADKYGTKDKPGSGMKHTWQEAEELGNDEPSMLTYYRTEAKRYKQLLDDRKKLLAEKFPDGEPKMVNVGDIDNHTIARSQGYRDWLKQRFSPDKDGNFAGFANLDFNDTGLADTDELNTDDFLAEMIHRGVIATETRNIIDQWASTSLDDDMDAQVMQYAVGLKFKVQGMDEMYKFIVRRHSPGYLDPDVESEAYDVERRIDEAYSKDQAKWDAYAEVMYQNTQAKFEAAGVTHVTLYRGMKMPREVVPPEVITEGTEGGLVNFNPLTSWAFSRREAESFGETHSHPGNQSYVFEITVPRERIFSSAVTGLGCLHEDEIVLLGGDYHVRGEFYSRERGYTSADPKAKDPYEDWPSAPPVPENVPLGKDALAQMAEYNSKLWDSDKISMNVKQEITDKFEDRVYTAKDHQDLKQLGEDFLKDNTVYNHLPASVVTAFNELLTARAKDLPETDFGHLLEDDPLHTNDGGLHDAGSLSVKIDEMQSVTQGPIMDNLIDDAYDVGLIDSHEAHELHLMSQVKQKQLSEALKTKPKKKAPASKKPMTIKQAAAQPVEVNLTPHHQVEVDYHTMMYHQINSAQSHKKLDNLKQVLEEDHQDGLLDDFEYHDLMTKLEAAYNVTPVHVPVKMAAKKPAAKPSPAVTSTKYLLKISGATSPAALKGIKANLFKAFDDGKISAVQFKALVKAINQKLDQLEA